MIPDVLECRELRLVDSNGTVRAMLTTKGSDSPLIQLADRNGLTRLTLGLDRDSNPNIGLLRENGETSVGIGVNKVGTTGCELTLPGNGPRLILEGYPDGAFRVRVLNSDEHLIWEWTSTTSQ